MTRNLKVLTAATVAAFALSAVVASGASAFTNFTSVTDNTRISSVVVFPVNWQTSDTSASCVELSAENTTLGTSQTELTVEPRYEGLCTISVGELGALEAQFDMNGCHYLFTASGSMHILCPEKKQIEITAKILGTFRKCLDIHAQTPTNPTVKYFNGGGELAMNIEAELKITGITYEKTGSCALGTVEGNNGSIFGSIEFTGENEAGQQVNMTAS